MYDQVFVQAIHLLRVSLVDLEAADIPVVNDTLLRDALRKRHEAVLQAPSDHQLSRCTGVFLGQRSDGGMLCPRSSNHWSICFHHDIVLLAG